MGAGWGHAKPDRIRRTGGFKMTVAMFQEYGYVLAFLVAVFEFSGVPFPGGLLLLSMGAAASAASLRLPGVVSAAVLGALVADTSWFLVARRHGRRMMRVYCRATLSSVTCTERTERFFGRIGLKSHAVASSCPASRPLRSPSRDFPVQR